MSECLERSDPFVDNSSLQPFSQLTHTEEPQPSLTKPDIRYSSQAESHTASRVPIFHSTICVSSLTVTPYTSHTRFMCCHGTAESSRGVTSGILECAAAPATSCSPLELALCFSAGRRHLES